MPAKGNKASSILATLPPVDDRTRVLKHGETFAVLDRYGDIWPAGLGEEGIYHDGTRFLSRFTLQINGRRPLLLGSTVQDDYALLSVDLTNPDLALNGELRLHKDTVHIHRRAFLYNAVAHAQFVLQNYGAEKVEISLTLGFQADYVDIFEVRGAVRPRRGRLLPPRIVASDRVDLTYEGLDQRRRRTVLQFDPPPTRLADSQAQYQLELESQGRRVIAVAASFDPASGCPTVAFHDSLEQAADEARRLRSADAQLRSSNEHFNAWVARSAGDLRLMATQTEHGIYPYAGVPWFSTVFGRDGIITALMYLWVNPELARGVLRFLAAHQSREMKPGRDAEPGKILHEMRGGEMAALDEVPFDCYYGTVDATPLFVMLAEAYYRRTGDLPLIESLWPSLAAAMNWIDEFGDRDLDGFVEYSRRCDQGVWNQGWKDSDDAVFRADGKLAQPPIAMCEVQAYVYAARRSFAALAETLGRVDEAARQRAAASALRDRFDEQFWCDELDTYALALDAEKAPCRVRSSNAGQCLMTGIVQPNRARRLARTLLDDDMFSGWGVRTLGEGDARYNPMSYHNGSIWPHDNALIAAGLARYDLQHEAQRIFEGIFDVSMHLELHRMPELFCGFPRRSGVGPTLYPVACAPQAWAAASVFKLVEALLGLGIDAPNREVRFDNPLLPESIRQLVIDDLVVGDARLSVSIDRHTHDVGVTVIRREGQVSVVVVK